MVTYSYRTLFYHRHWSRSHFIYV